MNEPKQVTDEKFDEWKKSKQKKYLDSWWSYLTKQIHGTKCAWCGKTTDAQSDHVRSRTLYPTRWRVENCLILCAGCHLFKKPSLPDEWYQVMIAKIGEDNYDALKVMSHSSERLNYADVKHYLEEVSEKVKKDKGQNV